MNRRPHFLLFSESRDQSHPVHGRRGSWRFVLESVGGSEQLEAADVEFGVSGERLELLAVVRGLEALDQPSRVTLITPSEHVRRGLRFGLEEWRRNDWMWERFGKLVPVKDRDLWQRVDRAVRIHDVRCRTFRFDLAHPPNPISPQTPAPWYDRVPTRRGRRRHPAAGQLTAASFLEPVAEWFRWAVAKSQHLTHPLT